MVHCPTIRLRAVMAACAGAALVLQPADPTTARASGSVPAGVAWSDCGAGSECADVQVPLDYDSPGGTQISLALMRVPAAVPQQRIGALFINPGGPGASGVDVVRGITPLLPPAVRNRFDIVGFDPRGVRRSTPLRCFATSAQAAAARPTFAFPVTAAQESVQRAADRALVDACTRRGGAVLHHMSTADTARDMDRLRQSLGEDRLNFLGFSYGSMLGQTYANLFPDRVRALVIDGVIDPVSWTTGHADEARRVPVSTRMRSDEGAQRALSEFFRTCDGAGPRCRFAGASSQRFAALAQRLRRLPAAVELPGGNPYLVTYADLISITLGGLYAPAVWPAIAAFLADVESAGPATAPGKALAAVRLGLGISDNGQDPYRNVVEAFAGVACADSRNPDLFTFWPAAAAAADRRFGYFGSPWTWASSACQRWPARVTADRYAGPWTARTHHPVLVIGTVFDPATPYRGAVAAVRQLPHARLLSYAGWGHTAFLAGNRCIDDHVATYLITRLVPAAGTVCQPERSPFDHDAAASSPGTDRTAIVGPSIIAGATRHVLDGLPARAQRSRR